MHLMTLKLIAFHSVGLESIVEKSNLLTDDGIVAIAHPSSIAIGSQTIIVFLSFQKGTKTVG